MNGINYKRTAMKLHDAGWGEKIFTSDDFSMLGYGYSVSQYPQFYYLSLDRYQVLPHPYLGSFEVYPGETIIKSKWVLDLAGQADTFFWGCIEKWYQRNVWEILKEWLITAKEKVPSQCRIGETIFTSIA